MADILSLKESVLVYLDRSGGLKKLCENCKHFNGMRFRSTAAMPAKITEFLTLLTVIFRHTADRGGVQVLYRC